MHYHPLYNAIEQIRIFFIARSRPRIVAMHIHNVKNEYVKEKEEDNLTSYCIHSCGETSCST
jgi:hypothetical protein